MTPDAPPEPGQPRERPGAAVVSIEPRPEPDAVAAIIAALTVPRPLVPGNWPDGRPSPWALAGRRAALGGRDGGSRLGWGRRADGAPTG